MPCCLAALDGVFGGGEATVTWFCGSTTLDKVRSGRKAERRTDSVAAGAGVDVGAKDEATTVGAEAKARVGTEAGA